MGHKNQQQHFKDQLQKPIRDLYFSNKHFIRTNTIM